MNKLEFVGLQETKKVEFNANILGLIDIDMNWNYMPAVGTAGGILVDFKD
jgi:hypothetical protein